MKSSRLAGSALAALLLALSPSASAQVVKGRVVVLGFDGADHRLVSQYMAEGKLPNLAKLAREGSFSPLRPTIPAQTPVSWSTFSTGLSPGRTQIFDFLKRDPKTYRPEFAIVSEGKKDFLLGRGNRAGAAAAGALLAFLLVFAIGRVALKRARPALLAALMLAAPAAFFSWRFGGFLPESLQTVVSHRQGTPFWEVAGKHGIRSVVLHVPVTFPAVDYDEGRLLSGLGVPDVRGRIGTPSYYTSDPFFAPKNKNEFSVELVRLESNVGTIRTEVFLGRAFMNIIDGAFGVLIAFFWGVVLMGLDLSHTNIAALALTIVITTLSTCGFGLLLGSVVGVVGLDPAQAALGTELMIPTMEGEYKLKVPEGTQSGTSFRIRNKGVPVLNSHGKGDLFVEVRVQTPGKLSKRQRELLQELEGGLSVENKPEPRTLLGR